MNASYKAGLCAAASAIAFATPLFAQTAPADRATVEEVVVTGSRITSAGATAPTPLTVVSVGDLQATTPTTIPEALTKLPILANSSTNVGNGGNGSGTQGATVNLRGFGAQRTLVLLDGHRVAPFNAAGTVNIDTLPQALMQRVDVVTGGASAVYGSDAITGVVNFVLDKRFKGLKLDVNAGISERGDAAKQKLSLAYGTELMGGRGHFEAAFSHYNEDGINNLSRPFGDKYVLLTGTGTAANPFRTSLYTAFSNSSGGGLITCTACGSLNNSQFVANGVVGPFNVGQTTGSSGINTNSDGGIDPDNSITTDLRTDSLFGRFSYDINDTTNFYVNLSGSQSKNLGHWYPAQYRAGSPFFSNNPFLPASVQAQFTQPQFTLSSFMYNQPLFENSGRNRNLGVTTGINGKLKDRFTWDLYYTHNDNKQRTSNPYNPDNAKKFAAADAVTSGGQIVCYASTVPALAARFPGCVPINPFGPTAVTNAAFEYITDETHYVLTNKMDDIGATLSGPIFTLPAGDVEAAVSAEYRKLGYSVVSNASPVEKVDCTGLRLCNSSSARWDTNVVATVEASQSVKELSGELSVPLLKDVVLAQSLGVNLAGRVTDYRTSGRVETWKLGADWTVIQGVRFRATKSRDIRAPSLNDLFAPTSASPLGYNDLHTGTTATVTSSSSGNPNLVPEVSRTLTAGVVLQPSFIPSFTLSVDYYKIRLTNAIGSLNGNNAQVAALCEAAGGTGPYCDLYVRPLPFSNRTPANFPSVVLSTGVNSAFAQLQGVDVEANYAFDLSNLSDALPGRVRLRGLATLQPINRNRTLPTTAVQRATSPKALATAFVSYTVGDLSINLQNRWRSAYNQNPDPAIIYVQPRIGSYNVTDLGVSYNFKKAGGDWTGYFNVSNLFDREPHLAPSSGNRNPGLSYPAANGEDIIGRAFILGFRARY